MALIKCNECGKEISDKSQSCIHCGCPIEKELLCNECGKKINKDDKVCKNCGCPIERKNPKNIFSKIWLILCIIICLGISIFNFFNNILNIEISSIVIGDLCINVMGILALILGVSYGILLKSFSKKAFHLVLGMNAIILVYNVLFLQMVTHLFYIICVILNSLITFFVVRKKLKSSKFSFKAYIPIFITLIVAIVLTIVLTLLTNGTIDIRSNARNYDIPQIQITTDYINIRDEKSVNSNILGEVYYGEIYDIISEDEESSYNWYEIETSNGIRGFIAGKSENVDYVKELEVNGVITNEEESNTKIDDRTPYEKFNDTLLSNGYTTSNNSYYIYNFGTNTNEMYRSVDLNKQLYLEYSYYSGLYMLTEYYYGSNIAKFTYKYMGYYGIIEWNLTTTKWTCNSSINNWCQDNGQEYVEKNLNDIINSFNELLNKANVSLEEIK